MKITKIEAIELRLPESDVIDKASSAQDSLIIKIHTDEGIVGIGEVDSCPRVAKAAIEAPFSHSVASGLGRILTGMNPLDIRVINEKLYQSTFYYGRRGVVVHAIGGIDIALWDIAGKYYNQPVYQLLGGKTRFAVDCYSHASGPTPEKVMEHVEQIKEEGFRNIRIQLGGSGSTHLPIDPAYKRHGFGTEKDNTI